MMVSIILPIRNEVKYLRRSLESILNQKLLPEKFEILIADGISTDGTRDIIADFVQNFDEIFLIDNPEKIVSTGFNRALSISKGDIIIRVDGHTEISSDYLENCLNLIKNIDADCVGGKLDHFSIGIIGTAINYAQTSKFGVGGVVFREGAQDGRYVDTLAFGAYKREIFSTIGGYDEELIRNQDDEFNFRLIQNGGKIWFDPIIKSTYYPRTSLIKLFKQYYYYGLYKIRVMQKRKRFASIRHVVPLAFVSSILLSLLLFQYFKIQIPLYTILGSYLLFNIGATLIQLFNNPSNFLSLLLLPFVYITMHFAYGVGSLLGIFYFINKWGYGETQDRHFKRENF